MTDPFDRIGEHIVDGSGSGLGRHGAEGVQAVASGGVPLDQDPRFQIPLYLALGIFCGLTIGLVGFNAANSFGPTTTESATISSIDVEINQENESMARTYYVSGDSETGRTWRFPSQEAYDLADRQGYPIEATVTFSDITGSAVGLEMQDIDQSLAGTANRIFFTVATVSALALTALGVWLMRKQGLAVVPFVIGVVPIGSWLGFIAMRAWRGA